MTIKGIKILEMILEEELILTFHESSFKYILYLIMIYLSCIIIICTMGFLLFLTYEKITKF